ncbi:hypothetical protein [Methanococcus maripaludis]|nr:hypothetical protein [Methanococcus maripaludis]
MNVSTIIYNIIIIGKNMILIHLLDLTGKICGCMGWKNSFGSR